MGSGQPLIYGQDPGQSILEVEWCGLSRLVNRLSLSIVIADMVVNLAILISVTAAGSPLQILVVAGFIATLGLSIWLLISILRGTS